VRTHALAILMVLLSLTTSVAAQTEARLVGPGPSRHLREVAIHPLEPALAVDSVRRIPPTHWKEGAFVGGLTAGLALGLWVDAWCRNSEVSGSCAGVFSAGFLLGGVRGGVVGALIGGQFPKEDKP
jgi:hypothetical protein